MDDTTLAPTLFGPVPLALLFAVAIVLGKYCAMSAAFCVAATCLACWSDVEGVEWSVELEPPEEFVSEVAGARLPPEAGIVVS